MPLTPLVPAARPGDTDRRWSVAASTVLHLAALAVVLGIAARQPPQPGAGAPSFDLIFESPAPAPDQAKPPGLPPIQPADIPPPEEAPLGTPAPAPLSPPQPDGAAAPQPEAAQSTSAPASAPAPEPAETARPAPALSEAPAPEAATPVAPVTAAPPPPPLASAPPEPVVTAEPAPEAVRPPPTPPEVNLRLPANRTGQSILRLDTTPIMPKPPAPLPSAPPRPRVPRRQAVGTLSNPMNLSLGPAAPRPAARGSVASRAVDLSPPPERDGPSRSDAFAQIRAANASADWNRGLLQYWLRHRFYPQQAAVNGEEGTVTIQLTVDRSGRVQDVEVLSRSGSQWLDMAAVATFRGAQLPPFTNEMRQNKLTFPIPITYYLLRR